MPPFYQARLGTNIGKAALKKEARFLTARRGHPRIPPAV